MYFLRLFYILLISSLSFSVFSHDIEGNSFEESKEIIEVTIKNLRPENLVVDKASSENKLKVLYRGEIVYLDRSVMLDALTKIYGEMSTALTPEEKIVLNEMKETIFSMMKRKSIDLAKGPFIFFHDLIKHLPENLQHLKLSLPKYYYSRGPASLIVIAVTQIAWETVETAVSWAIGAGGAHAYCVVFNIALLKLVDNSKSFFDYLLAKGTNLSTMNRVRIFTLSILRDWKDGKGSLAQLREIERASKNENMKEVFKQYGADRSRNLKDSVKAHPGYHELIEGMAPRRVKSQNLWDSYQFNLGLDYLDHVIQEHLSALTEKVMEDYSGKSRKERLSRVWKLKVIQGKLIKAKQGLKLHLTLGKFDQKEFSNSEYLGRYGIFFELIERFYELSIASLEKNARLFELKYTYLNEEISQMNRFSKKNIYQYSFSSCLKAIF